MGHRTVKRVLLYWQWPLHEVWQGYVNPFQGEIPCQACGRTGLTPVARQLDEDFYDFAERGTRWCDKITQDEVDEIVRRRFLVDWAIAWPPENAWPRLGDNYVPTAQEVNAAQSGLSIARRHDRINRSILVEYRTRKAGHEVARESCQGSGFTESQDREIARLYREWQPCEPPEGPGWQLWETVSDGSPITPVFESAEKLAEFCVVGATIFGTMQMCCKEWLRFILGTEAEQSAGSLLILTDSGLSVLAQGSVL